MKATIQDGKLSIDMEELIASLTEDERRRFAQYAVFNETLLEAVVETVTKGGCFEEYWYIGGLADRLRLLLLPLMPDAVTELVTKLLEDRNRLKNANHKYYSALHGILYHWPSAIPRPKGLDTPEYHSGLYQPMDKAEVEAWIASQLPPGEWEAAKAQCGAAPVEGTVTQ